MSTFGSRIYAKVRRPEKALVEQFTGLGVADISDCMNRMGCLDSAIRPLNNVNLLGTAITVKLPGGNNLMFHVALSMAQEGDVIIVDGEGYTERGLSGENMIEIARQKGVRGFVVDGAIRDAQAAVDCRDFSVYSRAIHPNGAFKGSGPGEVNVPVCVGGVIVYPGDIVVGDGDGVVVVRPQFAEEVARDATALADKQSKNLELIKAGKSDRTWVKKALETAGYQILEQAWDETI